MKKSMKMRCFDALVDFSLSGKDLPSDVFLHVKKKRVPATIEFYEMVSEEVRKESFIRVCPRQALFMKWKETFEVEGVRNREVLGGGTVLNPISSKIKGKSVKRRLRFLKFLRGETREMLLTLANEKGMQGLRETEIKDFCRLPRESLRQLCEELEKEGEIRILSFSPIFIISQQNLDFLSKKIVVFLEQFHRKHPEENGLSKERIKKRLGLNQKILTLSLKHLEKQDLIRELEGIIALSAFKIVLTPEEERILRELEELCFKGEYRSVSIEEFQKRFHLSSKKTQMLLSVLTERKRIVQGKDGFFLHSRWLNDVISLLKKSGQKEFKISDFKKITGLSRKYAIPLLELLDQMGATRRKSSSMREIL